MGQTLTIRTATPADLSAVDALLARSYPVLLKPDYPPSILVTAVPLLSKAQPALMRSGSYFVVEADGGIVGAGGVTRAAPPGWPTRRGVGHIRHVVTDHSRTRQGIGTALMTRIFDHARRGGLRDLECLSTRTAEPFYAACGFTRVAPVLVPLRPGIEFPAILMERRSQ